jgi:hypothetical protein
MKLVLVPMKSRSPTVQTMSSRCPWLFRSRSDLAKLGNLLTPMHSSKVFSLSLKVQAGETATAAADASNADAGKGDDGKADAGKGKAKAKGSAKAKAKSKPAKSKKPALPAEGSMSDSAVFCEDLWNAVSFTMHRIPSASHNDARIMEVVAIGITFALNGRVDIMPKANAPQSQCFKQWSKLRPVLKSLLLEYHEHAIDVSADPDLQGVHDETDDKDAEAAEQPARDAGAGATHSCDRIAEASSKCHCKAGAYPTQHRNRNTDRTQFMTHRSPPARCLLVRCCGRV